MSDKYGMIIDGTEEADELNGSSHGDIIDGRGGADRMAGGAGHDIYFVENSRDWVIERPAHGTDEVRAAINYVLPENVENLTLLVGAVNGFGNSLDNLITGNESNNVLRGNDGNDAIFGNGGNDLLDGGTGNDHLEGGIGNDLYFVDSAGDVVVEQTGGGTDSVFSSVDYALGANVEGLRLTGSTAVNGSGNELNNTINGNWAANVLEGFAGNDQMGGVGGNDTLNGGAGNDKLFGGPGDDSLDGGTGADRLYGGPGNDILTGGEGADRFSFEAPLNESTNVDTITDFSADDTIVLVASVFSGLAGGNLDPSAFHLGSEAADADDRIIYDSSTGALYHDADGNGAGTQQLFAYVTPGSDVTAADFFIFG